jgi:hypothetical protein
MSGRGETILVGLIALGLVPWIGWTLARGLRDGRLPIARAYVVRAERGGAFHVLLALYAIALALAAFIAADLLLGLNWRDLR